MSKEALDAYTESLQEAAKTAQGDSVTRRDAEEAAGNAVEALLGTYVKSIGFAHVTQAVKQQCRNGGHRASEVSEVRMHVTTPMQQQPPLYTTTLHFTRAPIPASPDAGEEPRDAALAQWNQRQPKPDEAFADGHQRG